MSVCIKLQFLTIKTYYALEVDEGIFAE